MWVPVDVRFSDFDDQGHVNNAVYLTYFEQGRMGYFDAVRRAALAAALGTGAADAGDAPESGRTIRVAPAATNGRLELPLVVSDAHIAYRQPIAAMVPIAVGVRTTRLGRASLVLEYAVRASREGTLYATGGTTIVCVDLATGRPRGLPPWTLDAVRRVEAGQAKDGRA